ncbi:MAG: helicase SNF2, partial [Algoriphagus sp. 32-45-6]
MIVNSDQPFQIVYAIFSHEFLGLLLESYVVQVDEQGRLSYAYQNISSANAKEFDSGLDKTDYELIKLMDSMQPEVAIKPYMKKTSLRPKDYLQKVFDPKTEDKNIQSLLFQNLEIKRSKILPLLIGKRLFETSSDGNPTWKEIKVNAEPAKVIFRFEKGEFNTLYSPKVLFNGKEIKLQEKRGIMLCNDPAWLVMDQQLFH